MSQELPAARRRFLQTAGGVLLLKPETVFGSQANSTVEVGLVGCGGRGNWSGGHGNGGHGGWNGGHGH